MVTIASFLRTGAKQTLQWTAPAEPSKNCLLIPLNQRAVGSPPLHGPPDFPVTLLISLGHLQRIRSRLRPSMTISPPHLNCFAPVLTALYWMMYIIFKPCGIQLSISKRPGNESSKPPHAAFEVAGVKGR